MRFTRLILSGFLLASAAFILTMLVAPPVSEASIDGPTSRSDAVTICATLPSGDIADCTIQN
jgi:hypothetical protein